MFCDEGVGLGPSLATIAGVAFTSAFFVMFLVSERITTRRRAEGAKMLDQFQVSSEHDIGAEVQLGRNVLGEIAFHRMPVDPNPPAPRVDGGSALVSSRSGVATDRINSCAIRAAASTIKS